MLGNLFLRIFDIFSESKRKQQRLWKKNTTRCLHFTASCRWLSTTSFHVGMTSGFFAGILRLGYVPSEPIFQRSRLQHSCCSYPLGFFISLIFLHCSPYQHPSVLDEHLSLFVELFPDSSVVFKQHRLIHHPNVLRASGPFVYQIVLRYERKHQRLTHNICNFKNICKSLGLRHQICQFNDWRHSPSFKKHDFPGSWVKHLSTVFDSDFDNKNFFSLRRSVSFEARCDKGDKV